MSEFSDKCLMEGKDIANAPKCTVCNKAVEKFTKVYSHLASKVIYTAECHGDKEVVTVDDCTLQSALSFEVRDAFSQDNKSVEFTDKNGMIHLCDGLVDQRGVY